MKIIKDTGINLSSAVLNKILRMLFAILLFRFATPDDISRYYIGIAIGSLLLLPIYGVVLGIINRYVPYYLGKKKDPSSLVLNALILLISYVLILIIILYIFKSFLFKFYPTFQPVFIFFILQLINISIYKINFSLLNAFHKFKENLISTFIVNFVRLIGVSLFLLFYKHITYEYVISSFIFSITLSTVYVLNIVKKEIKFKLDFSFNEKELKNKLKYGISTIFSDVRTYVLTRFDVLLLGIYTSSFVVSAYNLILTIVRGIIETLKQPLNQTLLPHMSKNVGENKDNKQLLNLSLKYSAYIFLFVYIFIFLAAKDLIALMSKKYTEFYSIAWLISLISLIGVFLSILLNYLKAIRWARPIFLSAIVGLSLNIVLDIIFIPTLSDKTIYFFYNRVFIRNFNK